MQIVHFCPWAIFFGRLLKYANASNKNCEGEKGKKERKKGAVEEKKSSLHLGSSSFPLKETEGFSLIRALVLVLFALSVKGLSNYAESVTQNGLRTRRK